MVTPNPYAPPSADVHDIFDSSAPLEHADRATRLGAALLDGIIAGAMVYGPMLVAVAAGGAVSATSNTEPSGLIVGGAVFSCVGFGVWCWLTIRDVSRNGQSIAKKMLGIKVVRADGSPASLGRIFWLRNVVNLLLGAVTLNTYSLIDVLFIFSEGRQCLHDKIADTIVVKA